MEIFSLPYRFYYIYSGIYSVGTLSMDIKIINPDSPVQTYDNGKQIAKPKFKG